VLGVDLEGQKELLGMWMSQSEGAKFWLAVFTELQNRGVKDIFIAIEEHDLSMVKRAGCKTAG
jgi:transposase-like protein